MRMFCAWILTLLGGSTAFIGLAMLVMLPIQAAQNRELLERVKQAAVFQVKTGHLPKRYQYDPNKSGIGSMWVDKLDGCDPAFAPPRSDRFVISFWQGDWWNCYGYPSGTTTLRTSVVGYLASEAGLEILINGLVAAVTFWGARQLRRGNDHGDLSLLAKAIWLGGWMVLADLFYGVLNSTDDEFVKEPGYIKWFVVVFDHTVYPFYSLIFGSHGYGLLFTIPIGRTIWIPALFIFWGSMAYLIGWFFNFTKKSLRAKQLAQ